MFTALKTSENIKQTNLLSTCYNMCQHRLCALKGLNNRVGSQKVISFER